VSYKIKLVSSKSDENQEAEENFLTQTPHSLGLELSNKIVSVDKVSGTIDPFDSVDLNFTFNVDK